MYENHKYQDTNYAEERAIISEKLQNMYESRLLSLESLLEKIFLKVTHDKLLIAMADEEIESNFIIMRVQEIIESQINNQREKLIQDLSQRLAEEASIDFYKSELENVKALFENELNQMEVELKKFKKKYEGKVSQNSQFLKENEILLNQNSELKKNRESFNISELNKLKSENYQLEKNAKSLEKSKNMLESQNDELNRILNLQKQELSELKCDLVSLENIKSKYESLKSKFKVLQMKNCELQENKQNTKVIEELQNSNEKLQKIISNLEKNYQLEQKNHFECKNILKSKEKLSKHLKIQKEKLKKKVFSVEKSIQTLKKQHLSLAQEFFNFHSSISRLFKKSKEKIELKFQTDGLMSGFQLEKAGKRIEELMSYLDISEGNEAALMKVNSKALWRIEELEKRLQCFEKDELESRFRSKPQSNYNSVSRAEGKRSLSLHWKPKHI